MRQIKRKYDMIFGIFGAFRSQVKIMISISRVVHILRDQSKQKEDRTLHGKSLMSDSRSGSVNKKTWNRLFTCQSVFE